MGPDLSRVYHVMVRGSRGTDHVTARGHVGSVARGEARGRGHHAPQLRFEAAHGCLASAKIRQRI